MMAPGIENIRRIENGESTLGLSQTDVAYAASRGEGPFSAAGPAPKLRLLIALYPEAFAVIARTDTGIREFQDLRGKRIGIGRSGAGYTLTRDVVLGFFGRTISNPDRLLELGPAKQNLALCADKVDAIIFEAGHPNGLTQEATTGCPARLVRVAGPPIGRLLATHPYYVASIIPGAGRARGQGIASDAASSPTRVHVFRCSQAASAIDGALRVRRPRAVSGRNSVR